MQRGCRDAKTGVSRAAKRLLVFILRRLLNLRCAVVQPAALVASCSACRERSASVPPRL